MSDRYLSELAGQLILKKPNLPVPYKQGDVNVIFDALNSSLQNMYERKQLLLPNFAKSKSVCIFSDYGGETSPSKYLTYTFTFVDYDFLGVSFIKQMKEIRKKYKLDMPLKEIAFKDFGYGPLDRCLDEYLTLANNFVNGLVFTLAVDKKVPSLFGPNEKCISEQFAGAGYLNWKGHTAEKVMRILTVISYFTNLLIDSGKNIFWQTDEDDIVANSLKTEMVGQMLQNAIGYCANPKTYGTIGYGKPFAKGDGYFSDLLSLSDLVAGSIDYYYTRIDHPELSDDNEEANKVIHWLAIPGLGLKKIHLIIKQEGENLCPSVAVFRLKKLPVNVECIDVIL